MHLLYVHCLALFTVHGWCILIKMVNLLPLLFPMRLRTANSKTCFFSSFFYYLLLFLCMVDLNSGCEMRNVFVQLFRPNTVNSSLHGYPRSEAGNCPFWTKSNIDMAHAHCRPTTIQSASSCLIAYETE